MMMPCSRTPSHCTDKTPSDKMVSNCNHCHQSFRVSSVLPEGFCSKDCASCFHLFDGQYVPEQTAAQKRAAVFQFQQQLFDAEVESSTLLMNGTRHKRSPPIMIVDPSTPMHHHMVSNNSATSSAATSSNTTGSNTIAMTSSDDSQNAAPCLNRNLVINTSNSRLSAESHTSNEASEPEEEPTGWVRKVRKVVAFLSPRSSGAKKSSFDSY